MNGHVVWFTGLPSAGKSTLAARMQTRLQEQGTSCVLLDGDAMRQVLFPELGYSDEERDVFYRKLARLAHLLAQQDLIVLVAATAHRRKWRAVARQLHPEAYVEVFVDSDEAECQKRDAKGLYSAAVNRQIVELPGKQLCYERPDAPSVIAKGGHDDQALEAIVSKLAR